VKFYEQTSELKRDKKEWFIKLQFRKLFSDFRVTCSIGKRTQSLLIDDDVVLG
jgi:hypothetical protein